MRYQLTVFGAGSLVGKSVCRQAVRLGWDVNAFSIEDIRPQKKNYRRQIFYNDDLNWRQHITWNASYNYDGKFDRMHDEMKNCTGVVYLYEETPLIKSKKASFESNAIKLGKLCGDWSVRHYICVEDIANGGTISQEAEDAIGDNDEFLIVSLIRANKIYSYDQLKTCMPVYRNRTLRSMGVNVDQLDAINSETIAKAITTLIHDSSDTNVYRILDRQGVETYLRDKNIRFDSPEEQSRFYEIDGKNDENTDQFGTIQYGFDSSDYDNDNDSDNDSDDNENDNENENETENNSNNNNNNNNNTNGNEKDIKQNNFSNINENDNKDNRNNFKASHKINSIPTNSIESICITTQKHQSVES